MDREVQRFLRYHRTAGSSDKTVSWHKHIIGYFQHYLTDEGLPDTVAEGLTLAHARDWLDSLRERGLAPRSLASYCQSLKAFSRWLAEEEWLPKDPLTKLKPPKYDDKAKPTFTPEEVETLLAACTQHNRTPQTGLRDRAIMLLLYSTGLRASELVGLQVADLDWDKGLLLVKRGKGGKFRQLPLMGKAEKALDRYLSHKDLPGCTAVFQTDEGQPLTQNALVQMLDRYGAWTGIHCNAHKFRHSAAIQYLRNGGKIETLRAMLGHTTLTMTLHYARIAGVDLAAAHETADPARNLKVRV